MGTYLNRAIAAFGTDTRGLLEGGRYALLHTRSMEFDDLRPYIAGDEIRDIDWRATARSGEVLVKRFVTEKHHKIVAVCDTGRNTAALAPSGEFKRDIATTVLGAISLIAMRRADEVGMVYGDASGTVEIRPRRGEAHVESMLSQFYTRTLGEVAPSDIVAQLDHVATTHRRRLLVIVVSDEPDITPRLDEAVTTLADRHELLWMAIGDMSAVGADQGEQEAYDVATGRFVPDGTRLGPRVLAAYRAAEAQRMQELDDFFLTRGIPFARVGSTADIRPALMHVTEGYSHAR
ncbi:DUF58 domain-containing protein [Mycolicibacterium sp. 018/SC-01/001]|uniref:DUF58 domain-containing protein n=1 Tax=Mycolicibacterium sp. 018/SC-01/001 TaxID=2592069 RepID=UPI00117FB8E3|nr:DUF58 domain-containing protein [Mycolicibacterium sp. 018/SC-01/001]TRW78233.1 DUF58 domain-containing protein [Mycolicibacterium sp. 018/SC-01/001]